MTNKHQRRRKPSLQLRESRLSANSKEVQYVLRELKRGHETQALVQKADLQFSIKAARERARAASHLDVYPKLNIRPQRPNETPTRTANRRIHAMRRGLAPLYAAAREDSRKQRAQLLAQKRYPAFFDVTMGDPFTLSLLSSSDSVTATPEVLVIDGNLTLIPNAPVIDRSSPLTNQVRFGAVASSQLGYLSETAWLILTTFHVFSFSSSVNGSCALTGFFSPNAIFSLTAPDAVYFFPFWHAVPHATLFFRMSIRADHWLPNTPDGVPPHDSVQTVNVRPSVQLSGWGGPKTASGILNDGPGFLRLPPFIVNNDSRIVVTCIYNLWLLVTEGASGVVDAISSSNLGLNVSRIHVILNF